MNTMNNIVCNRQAEAHTNHDTELLSRSICAYAFPPEHINYYWSDGGMILHNKDTRPARKHVRFECVFTYWMLGAMPPVIIFDSSTLNTHTNRKTLHSIDLVNSIQNF